MDQVGLKRLLESSHEAVETAGTPADMPVSSVEYDSRKVVQGSLFAAIKGLTSDGMDFVKSAVEKGATAVLLEKERASEAGWLSEKGIQVLYAKDSRTALASLSSAFYCHPSKAMTVIGVTGTNGKTSITYMLESVYRAAGRKTGVIGTVNYRWGGHILSAPNTTPESRDLQEILFKMKNDGVEVVIMEVSSHALKLHRADYIDFDACIFTNLTRDHLDFHGDFEDYFAAKNRLFDLLDQSGKYGRAGVVNGDDEYGQRILARHEEFSYPLKSFGIGAHHFSALPKSIRNLITGVTYTLLTPGGEEVPLSLKLSGKFQIYNSIAAFAAAYMLKVPVESIQNGLERMKSVPGRFDVIGSDRGFSVIVDYAHTGDALLKLLQSVRDLQPRRLVTVFGCGGDRDKTKRPIMGGIAEENSDFCMVTSDNPRTEDPLKIINDILTGMKAENHKVIPDRAAAIREAIMDAGEGDIIVIAGKGHEDYQIIGKNKIHFDDRELADQCIRERAVR